MSRPLIYRVTPYRTILILLIAAGFTWFAVDSLTDSWGAPLLSTAFHSFRYGDVSVLENDIIGWLSICLFGFGGLFAAYQMLVRFFQGHCQVLNVNAEGIATPMITRNFRRIPWRNIKRLSNNEDILIIELVAPRENWVPKGRKLDRAVSQKGNRLYIDLYMYVALTGGDTDKLKKDLRELSQRYLDAK
ncbi:hypothetical protein [Lactiplantibacillus paraxiangfangensis]|uniref:hypothetical protein n=1 Tax=Lactiplantibacillus paraxiangfangensis TaxID=3076224 RepID=UPI0030C70F36